MNSPAPESASPYLTTPEAAAYVRKTRSGFDKWVTRRGIEPDARAGRIRLYLKSSLEKVLRADAQPWRRRAIG